MSHPPSRARTSPTAALSLVADNEPLELDHQPNGVAGRNWKAEARHWKEKAVASRSKANKSDVPSLWPPELQAKLYEARAAICQNNGKASFQGLFVGEDRNIRANASIMGLKGKPHWVIYDQNDAEQARKPLRFIPVSSGPSTDGPYHQAPEETYAWARITMPPDAPSDPSQGRVEVYRIDAGMPYSSSLADYPDSPLQAA